MTSQKAGGGIIILQTLLCELGTHFAALRKTKNYHQKQAVHRPSLHFKIGGNKLQYTFKNRMLE